MANTTYSRASFSIHYDMQDPDAQGWAFSFVGTTHEDDLVTASGPIDNLRDLRDALASYGTHDADFDIDTIPTFGGAEPADTEETWSWDETHLLVGACFDSHDLAIVSRDH